MFTCDTVTFSAAERSMPDRGWETVDVGAWLCRMLLLPFFCDSGRGGGCGFQIFHRSPHRARGQPIEDPSKE